MFASTFHEVYSVLWSTFSKGLFGIQNCTNGMLCIPRKAIIVGKNVSSYPVEMLPGHVECISAINNNRIFFHELFWENIVIVREAITFCIVNCVISIKNSNISYYKITLKVELILRLNNLKNQ